MPLFSSRPARVACGSHTRAYGATPVDRAKLRPPSVGSSWSAPNSYLAEIRVGTATSTSTRLSSIHLALPGGGFHKGRAAGHSRPV